MRKLILSLMVLASLVSCGKDNKVGAGSSTSAITNTDPSAIQLGTMIDSSEKYFQAGPTYGRYAYLAATTSNSNPNQTCEEKEGWFGIKYYVCKSNSTSNTAPNYTYTNANVDLTAKRNEIKGYINNASYGGISSVSGYAIRIITTSGITYIIDRSVPLQANPVVIQQPNGQSVNYAGYVNN